jgi:hypothetical protein
VNDERGRCPSVDQELRSGLAGDHLIDQLFIAVIRHDSQVDGIVGRAKYAFRVNMLNGQNGFSHESDVRTETSGRIPLNKIRQIREVICRTRKILKKNEPVTSD